jgi:uncharacterized membrane protein
MLDWYTIFKFLHVVASVAWVGGGVVLFFLGLRANAQKDEAATMRVIDQVVMLGPIWFIPASLATLILGVILAFIGGLWVHAWVILGLVGWAATFTTGNFVLKPTAEAMAKANAEGRTAEAQALGKKILEVSKFDYVMLFTVVADMVFRPGWGDIPLLAIMALVIAASAVLFLRPAFSGSGAASA